MKLEWYLWIALIAATALLLLDCRAFWRNSTRAEFSVSAMIAIPVELGIIAWIVIGGP